MADTISTQQLKNKLDAEEGTLLVDVLSENSFESLHIPGAINVPYEAGFVEKLEDVADISKDDEVIVYCASEECQASVNAASALEKAGYTNVIHYAGGLAGWQEAGNKLKGARAE